MELYLRPEQAIIACKIRLPESTNLSDISGDIIISPFELDRLATKKDGVKLVSCLSFRYNDDSTCNNIDAIPQHNCKLYDFLTRFDCFKDNIEYYLSLEEDFSRDIIQSGDFTCVGKINEWEFYRRYNSKSLVKSAATSFYFQKFMNSFDYKLED